MALTDSLLTWWKLDEASGASRADSVGGKTLSDIGTVDAAAGKIGDAASFSGSDYLRRLTSTGLGDSAYASFSGWCYRTADAVYWIWAELSGAGGGMTYWLGVNANLRQYIGAAYGEIATALPLNTWSHVVYVFDGTQADNATRLLGYLNGSVQSLSFSGTIPVAIPNDGGGASNAMMLGSLSGGSYYTGLVDMFGFWNRAISSAEVTELYNAGAGLDYPFSAGQPMGRRGVQVPGVAGRVRVTVGGGW